MFKNTKTNFERELLRFVASIFMVLCFFKPAIVSAQNSGAELAEIDLKLDEDNVRLEFDTKEELNGVLKALEKMKDSEIEVLLERDLYAKGFFSLIPMTENDDIIQAHMDNESDLNREAIGYTFDDYTETASVEEIKKLTIASELFAAVLNSSGEIKAGNIIHKYTPTGLYYVAENKIDQLNIYLENTELTIPRTDSYGPNEFFIPGDDGIRHYTMGCPDCNDPKDFLPPNDGGGGSGSGGGGTGSNGCATFEQFYQNCIKQCGEGEAPWVGNIFGTVRKCTDHFESKKRVKLKFWDQNYLLFITAGVKVKYQEKKFFAWWKKEVDEIRLGINSVYYEFDLADAIPQNNQLAPVTLIFNGEVFPLSQFGNLIEGSFVTPTIDFPFESGLEIVLPIVGEVSSGKINNLLQQFALDAVSGFLQSQFGQPMPTNITAVGMGTGTPSAPWRVATPAWKFAMIVKALNKILNLPLEEA